MKQLKLFIILFLLLGSAFSATSQGNAILDTIFYYYNGERIYIPQNKKYVVVYYNDTATFSSYEFVGINKVSVEEDIIVDSSNSTHRILINLGETDRSTARTALKNNTKIIGIEPVIGIDKITKLSRLFYVKLKADSDYSKLVSTSNLNRVAIVRAVPYCDRWYELEVSKNSAGNSIEMANRFWETGWFEKVDPGFLFDFKSNIDTCVTDSTFTTQWGLQSIHACEVWNLTTGNQGVKVAVIDQGADTNHRELSLAHIHYSYDAISRTTPAKIYCDIIDNHTICHGTLVSGIIFANHNANNIAGVSPNASLINISHDLDFNNDRKVAKMAEAINVALQHGANIINNSWGDRHGSIPKLHSSLIEEALDNAIDGNCIVVFAAGNSAPYMDYPATYREEILSVGAMERDSTRAFFSGFGNELDVVAPGVSITSTNHDNGYLVDEGTSYAAPHASGVAALMFSVNPNLTAVEVRTIIEQTAEKIGNYSYDSSTNHINGTWNIQMGYGLVDAHKAVVHAMEYGHDNILGSSTIADCEASIYQCDFLHPEIFTYSWSASSNLNIIENHGASVRVMPINVGTGTLSVDVYQQGRLMYSLTKSIQVTSVWSGITPVSTTPYNISSNTTWSTATYLPVTATIDPNVTLTITSNLLCGAGGRLIVRPGGKLIVDGGTLTSACEDVMWQGIEIVGDRTKQQLAQYQGTVELKNGARIENAMCAIRMGLREDTVTFATAGGIISATNTTFKNNRQSVVINSYAYTAPSGVIADYNSMFSRCTFTIDNSNLFAANNTAFAEHVRLWDVKGVTFEGCDFSNTTTNQYWNGRGICAEDAGVSVSTCCPPQPTFVCKCPEADATYNYFSGFTTAVEVNTTGNPYAVRMDECRFSNNGIGVRINGNQFATVTRCQFNLDHHPDHTFGNIGLVLDGSTGYTVEENLFERTTYPSGPNLIESSIGIAVSNSGISANSVYRNIFNNLTKGITVVGNNGLKRMDGLQMTCNHFEGNKYDIYLESGATVCEHQGSSAKGADNEFHNTSVNISNFYNPEVWRISYYYYNDNTDLYPAHSTGVDLTTVSALNSCPSTLCDHNNGGGIYLPLSGFASQVSAYASAVLGTDDDGLAGANDYSSLQALRQTLSDTYYAAVREIMSDTVLDLNELEQWHAAAQPIGDPYSLTETRFMLGNSEPFTADAEDAEMANYAEFHALKLALRDNAGAHAGAPQLNSQNSQNSPFINWYALTDGQIAQLQTIAERNTGRASVMAKGVLCFFHGICYEDDLLGDDNADNQDNNMETRSAKVPQQEGETNLTVYPNPADDVLFVELRGGAGIANVGLYDLQGRAVGTRFIASATGASATVNMRDIPAGVYVLRVKNTDGKEYHQKIVRK